MDDWTPKTEDVRNAYAWEDNYPYGGSHSEELAARFDRWLAKVVAEAEERGRLKALTNPAIERWVDSRGGTTL